MGLPDQMPTAFEAMEWLDKDAGNQVFCIADSWYTRRRWRHPYKRHDSLWDATIFAMTNHEMREAAAKRGER